MSSPRPPVFAGLRRLRLAGQSDLIVGAQRANVRAKNRFRRRAFDCHGVFAAGQQKTDQQC
jgi:hypothetical protein